MEIAFFGGTKPLLLTQKRCYSKVFGMEIQSEVYPSCFTRYDKILFIPRSSMLILVKGA